jgi:hypothetical protein
MSHSHIQHHRLAKQLQVETTEEDQHATFADGTSTPLYQTVVPVNLKIEEYSESLYLAVADWILASYGDKMEMI